MTITTELENNNNKIEQRMKLEITFEWEHWLMNSLSTKNWAS